MIKAASLCCALVLVTYLASVCSQVVPHSPCPDIFGYYRRNGSRIFGKISFSGEVPVSLLELESNYSVEGLIDDVGSIEVDSDTLWSYNRGETVYFRVHFPETPTLPRVTSVKVNGKTICKGPALVPKQNAVTNFMLGYTFRTSADVSFQPHRIATVSTSTPAPIVTRATTRLTTTESSKHRQEQTTQRSKPNTQRPVQQLSQTQLNNECGIRTNVNTIPLIFGGSSYTRGDLPWLVAIYEKSKVNLSFICGGTLVSNRHVVTAAHCLFLHNLTVNDLIVKVGVHYLVDWEDDFSINKVLMNATPHEDFDRTKLHNDIMVLTFKRRVQFNAYVRPICLWTGDTDLERVIGASGTVAGWGLQSIRGTETGEPKSVNIPIVHTSTCRASNAALQSLTSDKTFCAGDRNGAGPCTGDSGGGLYLVDGGKWRLRGIVSFSLSNQLGFCNLEEYVVFTDAAQYLPWIRKIMQEEYFD